MKTKPIMISSSIFLGILGISLTFIPDEIVSSLSVTSNPISTLSLQLLGAIYLGFAMLNWMAKGTLIGGIYNKPIAIGNFMHFTIGGLALIKIITEINAYTEIIIFLTVFYVIFAVLFAYIFKTNPT
jgi:hypothetical protein